MSKQKGDNLENFFRDRAQYNNIEFMEKDWQKLEKLLDKEMPVTGFIPLFLRKFWYLPVLLFLFPLAWFSYDQFSNTSNNSTEIDLSNSKGNAEVIVQPINPNSENSELQEKSLGSSITKNGNTNSTTTSPSKFQNTQAILVADESQEDQNGNIKSKEIGYAVAENGALSYRTSTVGLHFLSSIPPESSISGAQPEITAYHEYYDLVIPSKHKSTSFYVGVGYSPDFSTVGIGNFISPGSRWTALVEYGISKRFLLNTGFVMVNNKYEAYGEDYHAPKRYWQKGTVADQAYGECKMIDIPLNLRYNFLVKGRSQAFISAGASTYFVLKEDYYFHYEKEDPDLPDHWGTDKMTIYPFGIINFSMGFQYDLTERSSFQIEPFIKIPTTGIGWGNVDLHTMGAFFMYKYKIGK